MSLIEEARQAYYEYRPDESEWWVKTPPPREPWFDSELARIGGYHPNGKPNLRVVWGGTEMNDITERPQLKYMRTRTIIKGYRYERIDGSIGYVRKGHRMPESEIALIKDKTQMVPVREDHHFGRLRWHIERYCPPEKLKQLGRFSRLYAEDGTKVLRDFPNEGVYDCFFVVQRRNSTYRDLDQQVLTAIEAIYHFNLSVEEAQCGLDAIEEHNETLLTHDYAAKAVFN